MLPSSLPARSAPVGVSADFSASASFGRTAAAAVLDRQAMKAKTLILLGTALLPVLVKADDLRWTNTVRLSTSYQINWVPPLADDNCSGGLNCGYGADFTQGRADFLSELDWSRNDYGLRASLEARKDAVEPASSFIDLSEAYVHGTFDLFGKPLTAAIGRQSVIWGESLYFAGNGIAGAQAPVDSTANDTTGYAATHFLPVGQTSLSWQVGGDITLLAYQQFEWRRNRVDPQDAYASAGDVLGNDHLSRISIYNPEYGPIYYTRAGDPTPGGTDQFGLGLKLRRDEWDLGLYALQFDAKTPDLFYVRGVHTYSLRYAQAAGLIGASFTGPLGDATMAGEVSARRHAAWPGLGNPADRACRAAAGRRRLDHRAGRQPAAVDHRQSGPARPRPHARRRGAAHGADGEVLSGAAARGSVGAAGLRLEFRRQFVGAAGHEPRHRRYEPGRRRHFRPGLDRQPDRHPLFRPGQCADPRLSRPSAVRLGQDRGFYSVCFLRSSCSRTQPRCAAGSRARPLDTSGPARRPSG